MPEGDLPSSGVVAAISRRDGALDAALERIISTPAARAAREAITARPRPDTPDLHITAVRRLPSVAAEYAPFPVALDDRLSRILDARGIGQLYTHQAEAIDHAL